MRAKIVFFMVCVVSAFIGWLAGYNFDHRGMDVAAWCIITLLIAPAVIGTDAAFCEINKSRNDHGCLNPSISFPSDSASK